MGWEHGSMASVASGSGSREFNGKEEPERGNWKWREAFNLTACPPGTYFLQQGSQPIPAPGPAPEPPPGNQVLKYPSPWGNFSQRLSRALNAEKGVSKHRTVAA